MSTSGCRIEMIQSGATAIPRSCSLCGLGGCKKGHADPYKPPSRPLSPGDDLVLKTGERYRYVKDMKKAYFRDHADADGLYLAFPWPWSRRCCRMARRTSTRARREHESLLRAVALHCGPPLLRRMGKREGRWPRRSPRALLPSMRPPPGKGAVLMSPAMIEALEAMRIAHGHYMTADDRSREEREAKLAYDMAAAAVVVAWELDSERIGVAMLRTQWMVDR